MQAKWITAVLFIGVAGLFVSPTAALTTQSAIEDFSNVPLAVYSTGAQKAPAGSAHLYGWEIGGHCFSIQDAGSDRVMNPNASYSGLDIGIKLAVLNSEYQPVWDETLRSNAISLAYASDMQFKFVNMASASRTLTSGLTVILYYYDTSAAATATASLKVLANNAAFAAGETKTVTVSMDTITGFDKTADLVYGFRIYQATYNQQVAWSSVTCTVTSDGLPAPGAVTNVGSTAVHPRDLTLTWTAPSDPTGFPDCVASYDIRYSTATIDDSNWAAATPVTGAPTPALPGTAQTCLVQGLVAGTTYFFALRSTDAFGNVSTLSNIHQVTMGPPDVIAPAAIADLAGTVFRATNVILTWTASGDDGSVGTAASYDLRYATYPISDATWSAATAVPGLPVPQPSGAAETFTITSLQPNTTYYFAIKVSDEWPNTSAISNMVTITMPVADVWPPYTVTDLAVNGAASRTATLRWTAPADQGAAGVAGYDVRYSTSPIDETNWAAATQAAGEPAAATPGTVVSFTVSGLQSSTTYYFAMKSFDWASPANVSAISNGASAMTRAPLLPVTVHNPWLVNDRVADTHNLNTMGATYVSAYTPGGVVAPTSSEQKCINIYNNQKRRLYHWADEPPSVGGNSISDPTYNQNVFGWSLCGRHADQGMTIAQAAGFSSRNVGVPGHNIYEVQHDGGWHLYDTMTTMYVYTINTPQHIANLAEISADHNIMLNAVADGRACPGYLLCGDTPAWYVDAADHWGAGGTTPKVPHWTGAMDLRLGQTFKRTWEAWQNQHPTAKSNADTMAGNDPPYHHEADKDWKDTVNFPYWEPYGQVISYIHTSKATYRRWSNGTDTLAPDFSNGGYSSMLEPTSHDVAAAYDDSLSPDLHLKTLGTQGEAIFKISVPFYITDAGFRGTFVKTVAADTCKVFFSSNGTSWTQVYDAPVGTTTVANQSLRTNVFGLWATYYIKIQINSTASKTNVGVSNFAVTTTFEHNKGAMAYLDKGVNHITVTFDNASELLASHNGLHVTYKWKEYDGAAWTIDKSFETDVMASPSTFTINVGGNKVPRTEYIQMEVVQGPYDPVPPPPVQNLAAGEAQPTKVPFTWTAPTDFGANNEGPFACATYDLRYNTSPISDDASFNAATPVADVPGPGAPGAAENFLVTGLSPSTTYWFALKSYDRGGNASPLSNVVIVHTPEADTIPPDWVGNLMGKPSNTGGGVDLKWTAPADWGIGHSGPYTCASYELRYSTSPIAYDDGGASWNAAAVASGLSAPKAPGQAESFSVTGLTGGTVYYFGLKATDDAGNISQVSNSAPVQASTIGQKTLQFGVDGYTGITDSYCFVGSTSNYYTLERMVVCGYGAGNYQRGILKFDLSGLPAGATITSATLSLYSYYPAQTKGSTGAYGAYPITTDWSQSQCTWTLAKTGVNWTNPGGDFLADPDATSAKKAAASVPAWYDWDVTTRVRSWLAGTGTNLGWVIKCTDESRSNQDYFYQSDTANAAYRPKLVISDLAAAVPGDISGDGSVDVLDLLYLVDSFGSICGTDRAYNPLCDFNSDGGVDVVDLLTFVQDYWPQ